MSTGRIFLYLLILFAAYGLVGRSDYEVAVRMANALKEGRPLLPPPSLAGGILPEQAEQ